MNSRALLLLLVDLTGGVFQNHIGEYRSIRRLRKVRAKADAYVERSVEVQVDGRAELMHRFAFQAHEECEGVSLFFDAYALGEYRHQAVRAGAARWAMTGSCLRRAEPRWPLWSRHRGSGE